MEIVGRDSDGSGFSFGSGARDMDWTYVQRTPALNAYKRLRAKRVRAEFCVMDGEATWPLIDPDTGESYARDYMAPREETALDRPLIVNTYRGR